MRAFWFSLFLCYTCSAFPQGGIYIVASDYLRDSLSFKFSCDSGKILTGNAVGGKSIRIVNHGIRRQFRKDSIFGYRDCDSNVFRIYHSEEKTYKILESKSITIYSRDLPLRSSAGKPVNLVETYFFSAGPDSVIWPLTVLELKRALPTLYSFHSTLDLVFGDGLPIQTYDANHKMYLVNYLLYLALKTQDKH